MICVPGSLFKDFGDLHASGIFHNGCGSCNRILLFFVAVMSPDNTFSSNSSQGVLISTSSYFRFSASLLKSIALLLPTNYNNIAASQLSFESA